jgi:uncharacterized protein YgbK (DUF1537 family)
MFIGTAEKFRKIYNMNDMNREKKLVIVIDDDPTGIQTVHGINTYMTWTEGIIKDIFKEERLVFIQINSRSLPEHEAIAINKTIMQRLVKVSSELERDFSVISRSDSSLRGHFPAETQALREVYEAETNNRFDGEILVPAFFEAGRITLDDIHYIVERGSMTPVADTEFARDVVFGYRSSNLKEYIEEKTKGAYKASEAISIPNNLLKDNDIEAVASILQQVNGFNKVVVNATTYSELKTFALALNKAEELGKRFLFRSAASFVKVYAGIEDKAILRKQDLDLENGSGCLVIAGSHTAKTTSQIEELAKHPLVHMHELDLNCVAQGSDALETLIDGAVGFIEKCLQDKQIPVVYTQRQVIHKQDGDAEANLEWSRQISNMLVEMVRRLRVRPSLMIAKGGITSSDIAVKGLGIKKAGVLGQILSGVPVVVSGDESKWPGMPYVIFPGNVGTPESLLEIVNECFK